MLRFITDKLEKLEKEIEELKAKEIKKPIEENSEMCCCCKGEGTSLISVLGGTYTIKCIPCEGEGKIKCKTETKKPILKVWHPGVSGADYYLRLVEAPDGDIKMIGCDKDGEIIDKGNIFFLDENRKMKFVPDINAALGFKVDEDGFISHARAWIL